MEARPHLADAARSGLEDQDGPALRVGDVEEPASPGLHVGRAYAGRGRSQRAAVGRVSLDAPSPYPNDDGDVAIGRRGDPSRLHGRRQDLGGAVGSHDVHGVGQLVADEHRAAGDRRGVVGLAPDRDIGHHRAGGEGDPVEAVVVLRRHEHRAPGAASARCRAAPGRGTRARSTPVRPSTSTTPPGSRTATARMPVTGSKANPSGWPGSGTTVPGTVPLDAGATAGSGTSVRAVLPPPPHPAAMTAPASQA